jgi:Lsr2
MAQRVQVLLVCDVHGDDTPGTETVGFSVDGTSYEIDVCDKHAREMRDAFAPYVGNARRAGSARGGRGRAAGGGGGRSRGGGDRQRTAEIRRWAREQGRQVPDRGRLPASIVEEYEAAH